MRKTLHPLRHIGFTLVELLVVIGIIAVLISILLPSLARARQQALKLNDLSNIRQIGMACVMYAGENKGSYPRGDRGHLQGNDDLKWVYSPTYDYLLRILRSNSDTARDLAGGTNTIPSDKIVMMSCNTLYEMPDPGDYSGGRVDWYGLGPDDNPYADPVGYDEMQMGWIYWGGRDEPRIDGTLRLYPDGTAGTEKYVFPKKMGDRPTTKTLVTCYARATTGYGTMLPHFKKGYTAQLLGNSSQPFALTKQIEGMCMAYTDGSARFVQFDDFGAVTSYSGGWFFYDRNAN